MFGPEKTTSHHVLVIGLLVGWSLLVNCDLSLIHVCLADDSVQGPQEPLDWIRGSDTELEIRLRGSVVDGDGAAVINPKINLQLGQAKGDLMLNPAITGNEFELWFRPDTPTWYTMRIEARSADRKQLGLVLLTPFSLRQAAVDGIQPSNPQRYCRGMGFLMKAESYFSLKSLPIKTRSFMPKHR